MANLKTGVSRKQSTPSFPKNKYFLPPDMHTYVCLSRGKKYSFFGKFGGLCFFGTLGLRFAFLPYYRRFQIWMNTVFLAVQHVNVTFLILLDRNFAKLKNWKCIYRCWKTFRACWFYLTILTLCNSSNYTITMTFVSLLNTYPKDHSTSL